MNDESKMNEFLSDFLHEDLGSAELQHEASGANGGRDGRSYIYPQQR
jgi:hypothetical protein